MEYSKPCVYSVAPVDNSYRELSAILSRVSIALETLGDSIDSCQCCRWELCSRVPMVSRAIYAFDGSLRTLLLAMTSRTSRAPQDLGQSIKIITFHSSQPEYQGCPDLSMHSTPSSAIAIDTLDERIKIDESSRCASIDSIDTSSRENRELSVRVV